MARYSAALSRLVEDTTLVAQRGARTRARALESFSLPALADAYEAVDAEAISLH